MAHRPEPDPGVVLLLVFVLLLVLAVVWATQDSAHGAVPRPLVAVSQNVRVTLPRPLAAHDIARAAQGADVVLLQEMNARRTARYAPPGWASYQARVFSMRGEAPVLWRRSSLALVAARVVLLHRSTLCQSCTRWATVVRFTVRRSGLCLRVVNLHMVPGIDRAGYLVRAPRAWLARRAVAVIARLARGVPGCATLVGGDWNFGYWNDARVRLRGLPYASLHPLGYRAQWVLPGGGPTFGHRYIDTLWQRGLHLAWQQVRGRTYSDHQQVRVGFWVRHQA